jgi:hypothetical protein
MSAPRREGADGPWFPPPSTFTWSWSIPSEILEPLLRRPAPEAGTDPVRSSDGRGPDAEHAAR